MVTRSLLAVVLLSSFAAFARSTPVARHIEIQKAVPQSEDCALGIVYDDGEFNIGYSIGEGEPGAATMVMKFDLPAGTTTLDQVCTCFSPGFGAPVTNVESVVKVIDGCSANSRYWVFAAGLTDVRVTVTVTDTKTGQVKTYTNPLGTPFAPVQDTSAFATCP